MNLLKELQSTNMTIKQLKVYLSKYNLKQSGKKEELISRLIDFCNQFL
jgi:hypothetical protein